MKTNTKDFVSKLEKSVVGLIFMSESDGALKVLAPISGDVDEVSLENLLVAEDFLKPIEADNFLESFEEDYLKKGMREKAESLITLLQTDFEKLQIHRITVMDGYDGVDEQEAFSFITAKHKNGDWLGIAPKMDAEAGDKRSELFPLEKYSTADENLLDLTAKIEAILKGCEWVIVEYLAPDVKKEFVVAVAPTKNLLFKSLLGEMNFVKICKYEGLGDSVYDPEDVIETVDEIGHVKRESPKRNEVEKLIAENLSDLKEYVIGGTAVFRICDLGRTEDGDYTGVSANVTWT